MTLLFCPQAPSLLITLINMFLKFGGSPDVTNTDPTQIQYSVFGHTDELAQLQVILIHIVVIYIICVYNYIAKITYGSCFPFHFYYVLIVFTEIYSNCFGDCGVGVCTVDVACQAYLPPYQTQNAVKGTLYCVACI